MKTYSKKEIDTLVHQFQNQTLPKEEWTHEAHLMVALWHNWYFEWEEAFDLVKQGIIVYNEAVGTANTDSSGYHETLTQFWMRVTKNFLQKGNFESIEVAANDFLKSDDNSKHLPLKYYTKSSLFSTKARKEWVEGDLAEIEVKNRDIEGEKPLLLQSEGFTISGYKIPNLTLKKGEMLRLWVVEGVSDSRKNVGDYWGRKKMQEVIEVIDGGSKQLKFCPNQIKRGFVDWFKPISVGEYVNKNFDWTQEEVDEYLAPLGIKANYLLKNLGTGHQKVFAIVCAFQEESIPCFGYYGLSFDSTESLTNYVKKELKKGKSAIAFDYLPFKPENPDSDGIVNLVVGRENI